MHLQYIRPKPNLKMINYRRFLGQQVFWCSFRGLDNSPLVIVQLNLCMRFGRVNTRVITPHHNALVFTLCINDFDVHRVLVYPSSETDLLQLAAFRQMNISFDRLSSAGRIMSGFNGATTVTIGDIALPVKAGPVVQQVLFSIVEDLGSYNVIICQAWLHAMKVVPSTYHQMTSYLTSVGKIDLLSSQLAARDCYQLSIQEREKNESSYNLDLET